MRLHIDAINCLPGHHAKVLLCDTDLHLSRSGAKDVVKGIILLRNHLKSGRYDGVITITPKGGFLLSIANFFIGIPQTHWFTGQVWANDHGIRRFLKRLPDLVISMLACKLLCDSKPQREYLLASGFHYFEEKLVVPGAGSICGVDDAILDDTSLQSTPKATTEVRIGIVGRVNEDKGILWLLETIKLLFPNNNQYRFIFIGAIDGGEACENIFLQAVKSNDLIEYLGEITDKRKIYSSFDVLLSCSYREGFSNTIIEAQAFLIPVIVRDIYAVESSYIEGKTGVCFKTDRQLFEKLCFFSDLSERIKFGERGHQFVKDNFRTSTVIQNCLEQYID